MADSSSVPSSTLPRHHEAPHFRLQESSTSQVYTTQLDYLCLDLRTDADLSQHRRQRLRVCDFGFGIWPGRQQKWCQLNFVSLGFRKLPSSATWSLVLAACWHTPCTDKAGTVIMHRV